MFSRRTSWARTPNRLGTQLDALKTAGVPLLDLSLSNPTRANLCDTSPLVAELGRPEAARYEPLPFGHPSARAAVARYYAERGANLAVDQIVLTASTSEAYGWLFTVLADAGDEVLVPRPSYPLLDWLGKTHEVGLVPYRLTEPGGFRLEVEEIERALTARSRAVVLVHPNNPTGSFVLEPEARELIELARARGLSLIVDEVFSDYAFPSAPAGRVPTFAGTSGVPTFVLNGLSKAAALPQLKLGWIAASGPRELAVEALGRLELLADTYLSVGTPVQLALPRLLEAAPRVIGAVRARLAENLATLDHALEHARGAGGVRRLPVEGGWYATIEVPRFRDDEAWALALLSEDRIVVQPGYFFEFERDGLLVVSLLPEPEVFRQGVGRLVDRVVRECG